MKQSSILKRTLCFLSVVISAVGAASADNFAKQCRAVEALAKLTTAPAMQEAKGYESNRNLKAIYFDALDWKGKPTKVFAWVGLPTGASKNNKVPAIVLVHGGGGTAFKNWVQKWQTKGFAAISIAVEGQTDVKAEGGQPKINTGWLKHQWSGPMRQGIYSDSKPDIPIKDQWMYHAVADTILANSLIRSLPEVDPSKVGLMGISWGGIITSTVIGIDDRFAFAIPTYGCGDLATASNQYGRALGRNEIYKQVWDPMLRLDKVTMPTMWFSWPGDSHFPMNHFAACYGKVKGDRIVTLIPKLRHGHGPPWLKPDSYAFAESVVKKGKPWGKQTAISRKGDKVSAAFDSSKPPVRAVLVSTRDKGASGARTWVESPAQLKQGEGSVSVEATLPKGTTAWFINVITKDGLTLSSDYQSAP